MKYKLFFWIAILLIIGPSFNVNGRPCEIFKGKLSPERFTPSKTADEYHIQADKYLDEGNYSQALLCSLVIAHHFKNSNYYANSLKQAATCYLKLGKPDLADRYLAQYVQMGDNNANFQEVCSLKFAIAQGYSKGIKKHLYGLEGMPRLENAEEDALRIYNEVISSFPSEEIASRSLFGKAGLLMTQKNYEESLKVFQTLIRQFPQSPLNPEAFIQISKIYFIQSILEPQNSKYLMGAANNLRRMKELYPTMDEKIKEAATHMSKIRENSAESLYHLGRFYEKKRKSTAARIYYHNAIQAFPETAAATKCKERIEKVAVLS